MASKLSILLRPISDEFLEILPYDFLFTGDAEQEAEASLLMEGVVLDVEVLKLGHHGSRTASSPDFLAVTSPEVAIYMAGEGNTYGHPHEETIEALLAAGAEIYGADIHGTIVVTTNGEEYELWLEKQAPPVTLSVTSLILPSELTRTTSIDLTKVAGV